MKRTLNCAFILIFSFSLSAQNSWHAAENERSDTFDIIKYDIELDLTRNDNSLNGVCTLEVVEIIKSQQNLRLDLLEMTVDSVLNFKQEHIPFTYNDTILDIDLSKQVVPYFIVVFYHGTPFHEAWGGWHNQSGYTFNLGVGFKSIPHNLGKVWHPCFDNFVERSKYSVRLKTAGGRVGVGSGMLTSEVNLGGDTLLRQWDLNEAIPTYLYGIAVSNYSVFRDTIKGIRRNVPVELHARSSDMARMKTLTNELDTAFKIYENRFGPYQWSRVGYVATPIGAMEHATNIAIPLSVGAATMAHELSHHWWGDLITCETDRDMWINEGMAVFSEYVFFEDRYGNDYKIDDMRGNHFEVVKNAHLKDGGYHPLSGVPRVHTYSTEHVYYRGGLIAHNLRTYLGDSLFYKGAKAVLDSFKFDHINSYQFRDVMSNETGVNLTEFFERWIFEPGFPDFVVEETKVEPPTGLNKVTFSLRQLKGGSVNFYTDVPLEITLMDDSWNTEIHKVKMNGETKSFELMTSISPKLFFINSARKLSYAMTFDEDTVYGPKTLSTRNTDFIVKSTTIKDSAYVRTEAHWAGAYISNKNAAELKVRIQDNRHWRIEGLRSATDTFTGQVIFNAKKGAYDYGLFKQKEDSVVLLFRPNGVSEWQIHQNYDFIVAAPNDSIGIIQIKDLQFGEYALGERDTSLKFIPNEIETNEDNVTGLNVYPNPTSENCTFSFDGPMIHSTLSILDYKGRQIMEVDLSNGNSVEINTREWDNGVYFYILKSQNEIRKYGRVVKVSK